MAESTDRIDDEVAETDALEGEQPAGRRGLPFWLVLGVAALVAAALGGYVSYAYYPQIAQTVLGVADDSTAAARPERVRKYGQFSTIDDVVINPAATEGQRFLMLSIGLEAEELATLEEVKEKDVVVRDTVLKVLGSRSVEELTDISKRNELKESLRLAVNAVLRKGDIERLYFTRYVLQ